MGIIRTVPGRCKRCYTCVRSCPVKALRVENGTAEVIDDFCVSCGTCVRSCNQKAKDVATDLPAVKAALASPVPIIALLAPSFPASFHDSSPQQVIGSLKQLGFTQVVEVAFGAELVGRDVAREQRERGGCRPKISSSCPVVVGLIERHFPELIPFISRTVSPVIAMGRYLRGQATERAVHVFIGPCIAKKQEIKETEVRGAIDFALTFAEAKQLLTEEGIVPRETRGAPADPPHPGAARVFPLMGGILRTGGMGTDVLDPRIAMIDGPAATMEFLSSFLTHPPEQDFIDILFCRGCIDGVAIDSPLSHLEKQRKVLELVSESRHLNPSSLPEIDLKRSYRDRKSPLPEPTPEEIIRILRSFGKALPEDELNCGACGYSTCREKAKAVFHGFAEPEMCLPQIIKQLEDSCDELQQSHAELMKAQNELVHSEKLASLGQLSAGVAHELNNPLGGILLFANILLERLQQSQSGEVPEEIEVIAQEATRCRFIVQGLLDFARQKKLQYVLTCVPAFVEEILQVSLKPFAAKVSVQRQFDDLLPETLIDATQMRQALTNIITNACEAMPNGGTLTIGVGRKDLENAFFIRITDTGTGIPPEDLPKLFTPFFTTKGIGKGTGLGLAIAYGIVKMHRGAITVDSTPGQGTSFEISLPLEIPHEETLLGTDSSFNQGDHT